MTKANVDRPNRGNVASEAVALIGTEKVKKILHHLNTPFDIFAFSSLLLSAPVEKDSDEKEKTEEEVIDSLVPYHSSLKQLYSLFWENCM